LQAPEPQPPIKELLQNIARVDEIELIKITTLAILENLAKDKSALRREYAESDIPNSVFEQRRSPGSIFGDEASMIGDEKFSFDNVVVDS